MRAFTPDATFPVDPLQRNGTGGFACPYPPDGRKPAVSRPDYVSGMVSLAQSGSSRSFDCVITEDGWERLAQAPRELIES